VCQVSEKAIVTEYLDVVPAPDGTQWLVLKTQVDDPTVSERLVSGELELQEGSHRRRNGVRRRASCCRA
jgi:hypothetical protein